MPFKYWRFLIQFQSSEGTAIKIPVNLLELLAPFYSALSTVSPLRCAEGVSGMQNAWE